MKILYLRLNDDIRLSVVTSSGQGVEHRRSFLHALVTQGHNVTIGSSCASECLADMSHRSLVGTNWMNKLKYDIDVDSSKFDICILEASSQNTRFHRDLPIPVNRLRGDVINDSLPSSIPSSRPGYEHYWFIKHNFHILNQFRGKVFLWHHIYTDNTIFPFARKYREHGKAGKPLKSLSEISHLNWRNLFKDFDPFEGKEWTILYHCLNDEYFKQTLDHSTYGCYKDFPQLKYLYIHLPKSFLDTKCVVNEKPMWDSLYIGSRYTHNTRYKDYDRLDNIKRFYDTPLYKSAIHGYFDGSKLNNIFTHATNLHSRSNIVTATQHWNNSYTHIFTESSTPSKSGSVTGRTFLSLNGGSILLLDKNISGIEKFGLPDYLVSDAEDASSRIAEIKTWSPAKREQIRQEQLSVFPDWIDINWNIVFSENKINIKKGDINE